MAETTTPYPVTLSVDYPDRPLNRLSTFFRIIAVIPIVVLFVLLSVPKTERAVKMLSTALTVDTTKVVSDPDTNEYLETDRREEEINRLQARESVLAEERQRFWTGIAINVAKILGILKVLIPLRIFGGAATIVILPTVLMLLFRRKYPRWWFDWNLALIKFSLRISAYLTLLRDEYPAVDEEQAVHVRIAYPNASSEVNRWLPLVKWLLAIPHYVVLVFLSLGALLCVVFAWFGILFTGRYPRSLFDLIVGVHRWWLRVSGYAFLLVTDRYPPFALKS